MVGMEEGCYHLSRSRGPKSGIRALLPLVAGLILRLAARLEVLPLPLLGLAGLVASTPAARHPLPLLTPVVRRGVALPVSGLAPAMKGRQ